MSDEVTLYEFWERLQKNRFKTFGSYRVDKIITNSCMLITFAFLFYIAWSSNFNLDYYICEVPASDMELCKNPFYIPTTWKNAEYLPVGEYGNKPGLLFNSAPWVTILIFVFGFIINHFIHNKKTLLERLNYGNENN